MIEFYFVVILYIQIKHPPSFLRPVCSFCIHDRILLLFVIRSLFLILFLDLSRKSLDLDDLDDFDLDDFDLDLDLDDLDFLDLDSNPMSIGSTTATSTRLLSSPIREGFWRSTAPSDKTIPSPSGSIISAKPQSMAPVVPRKSLDSDPLSIDSSDRSNRMSLDSETKFLSIMEARVQVGVVETVLEDAGDGAMDGGLNDDAIYMFGSVKDGRGDVGTEKRANSSSSSSSSNKGSSSYSFNNNNNNNEKDSGKRKRVQEVDGDGKYDDL